MRIITATGKIVNVKRVEPIRVEYEEGEWGGFRSERVVETIDEATGLRFLLEMCNGDYKDCSFVVGNIDLQLIREIHRKIFEDGKYDFSGMKLDRMSFWDDDNEVCDEDGRPFFVEHYGIEMEYLFNEVDTEKIS